MASTQLSVASGLVPKKLIVEARAVRFCDVGSLTRATTNPPSATASLEQTKVWVKLLDQLLTKPLPQTQRACATPVPSWG